MNVLIVSQRNVPRGLGRQLAYGSWYEAEATLAVTTEAHFLMLDHNIDRQSIRFRRLLGRQLRQRVKPGLSLPPSRRRVRIDGRYDVAVILPFTPWELPLLEELGGLHHVADRVVVWFPELWPSAAADQRLRHEPWHLVDDIFVSIHPAVRVLAEALGRPVHYLPMAADVPAFCPQSSCAERPIDVMNIGRRIPELHEALLDWARRTNHFYLYDTFTVAAMIDPLAHRRDLGQRYQRSAVSICSYPKHDLHQVTESRRIIPQRLWEGLAGGTTMIGMPPDEDLQRLAVGEVVVDLLPEDPHQGVAAIEKLLDSNANEIRRRNLELALRRHDWAHRWRQLFEVLELPVPLGTTERIADLARMADTLE